MPRRKKSYVIDDSTPTDELFKPIIDGELKGRGHDPEQIDPKIKRAMAAPPSEMKLIPRGEWDARIEEQERLQSSLQHYRDKMANGKFHQSLDQNGQGYCWAYSVVSTVMFTNAVANVPYRRLSAHSVACKVKNFRDQGGWCGLSAQYIRKNGVVPVELWPEKSMSRSHDTAEAWKEAKKFAITEDWVDLSQSVYDQNLTFDQVATCLLLNIPCAVDFNWWSHSVCAIRLVRVEAGSYGLAIINSWTDGWGDRGIGILRGSRSIPNGAVATRVVGLAA